MQKPFSVSKMLPSKKVEQRARKILVLENCALVAFVIAEILENAAFEVAGPATSATKAIKLIEEYGCDGAIIDADLENETSGPVALELTKRGTPFLTLTACPRERPPVFAAAPVLSKPFCSERLIAELERCLREHPEPPQGPGSDEKDSSPYRARACKTGRKTGLIGGRNFPRAFI